MLKGPGCLSGLLSLTHAYRVGPVGGDRVLMLLVCASGSCVALEGTSGAQGGNVLCMHLCVGGWPEPMCTSVLKLW